MNYKEFTRTQHEVFFFFERERETEKREKKKKNNEKKLKVKTFYIGLYIIQME